MSAKKYLLIISILLVFTRASFAQSFYGAFGIGEQRHFISTRAVGMGGAGLALSDNLVQNQLNPSIWTYTEYTSLNIGFLSEGLKMDTSPATTSRRAIWNTGTISIKAGNDFVFGAGVLPFTDADYSFKKQGNGFSQLVESDGGTSQAYFAGAYRFFNKISLGIKYLFYFGSEEETWLLSFNDSELGAVQNSIIQDKTGGTYSLSATAEVHPKLKLAGIYSNEADMEVDQTIVRLKGDPIGERRFKSKGADIKIPSSFGVGAAYSPSNRLELVFDYMSWDLSELDLNDGPNITYKDSKRISGGLEFKRSTGPGMPLWKRWDYRIGGYYWDLYLSDVDGSDVSEKFVSVGLGWQFSEFAIIGMTSITRIDLGFEGGIRSSDSGFTPSEKIIRFYISLSKGEKWFFRR